MFLLSLVLKTRMNSVVDTFLVNRCELWMTEGVTLASVRCQVWCGLLYYLLRHTGYSLNIVFFQRILESLPTFPRQHSAAIGCTKKNTSNRSDSKSHCVDSFEGFWQRYRRGRGCSGLWKNTIFPEHPVHICKLVNKGYQKFWGWSEGRVSLTD